MRDNLIDVAMNSALAATNAEARVRTLERHIRLAIDYFQQDAHGAGMAQLWTALGENMGMPDLDNRIDDI